MKHFQTNSPFQGLLLSMPCTIAIWGVILYFLTNLSSLSIGMIIGGIAFLVYVYVACPDADTQQ